MHPAPWLLMACLFLCTAAGAAPAPTSPRADLLQRPRAIAGTGGYRLVHSTRFAGGQHRRFQLQSQRWPDPVGGAPWSHRVELLQPDHATPGPALLVINNGVAYPGDREPHPGNDFSVALLQDLVRTLGMAVISIADVPPQAMALPGDPTLRTEDDLVAATWRRFLDAPDLHEDWPLQLPMTWAARSALDLADRELPSAQRPSYIVTGASKRGWTSWLLALADARVSHLAPVVMDMNWSALAPHIRQVYGGRWPVALRPYVSHGITGDLQSPAFARLMARIDPYHYLHGPLAPRLALPKLLLQASGDDFFPPDASRFYLDDLPGISTLRVAPNSDHGGIRRHLRDTLIPALRRWRAGAQLPQPHARWHPAHGYLRIDSGAEPVHRAVLWQAHNRDDRDFRYRCGVVYQAHPIAVHASAVLRVPLRIPAAGWSASFVELHYADGLVVTTPVQVLPQDRYPQHPPAQTGGACALAPEPVSAPAAALSGPQAQAPRLR